MRRNSAVIASIIGTVLLVAGLPGCRKDGPFEESPGGTEPDGYEFGEELAGGATSTGDWGENAFNHAAANLSSEENSRFVVGNSFFRQNWVTAPASTLGRDGLGPLFNAQSCTGCHMRDGRGFPSMDPMQVTGILYRLSVPGTDAHGGPAPHPVYGSQQQPHSILGVPDEGHFSISYASVTGAFADGTSYELMRPTYTFSGSSYGAMDDAMVSPRVGQQLCGMGLLEAINEADILINTLNAADGISGRPNYVHHVESNSTRMGRFGWKANEPTVRQQTAGAFNGDIGITSSIFPYDHCTPAQPACTDAINGNDEGEAFELRPLTLALVSFYTSSLGVPRRRNVRDAQVLKGKAIFNDIGCAHCHRPKYITGTSAASPAFSGQTIYPHTDLLLHDMGPDLADGRPDFLADGQEWRTPPLWGIGLFQTTNGHTRYLHDGRARDLNEAILWHGGEAAPAQERYRQLPTDQRQALITFLNSL